MRWIQPAAVFDGTELKTGHAVRIENGFIAEIGPVEDLAPGIAVEPTGDIFSVGLLDLQVNGGGGVLLNNRPDAGGVRAIGAAHKRAGTSHLFPTIMTDRPEVIERAALAVLAVYGSHGISGLHIEGPHINAAFRGAHSPEHIRPFDELTPSLLERLRSAGLPVLLTLAPECVEPGTISRLVRMGVVVSAGHSAANPDVTRRALGEGMKCFTHLFNGMPVMHSRAPGIVGTAINSDAWCGIIADGHHVDDRMLELAIRARPRPNRMIAVSDAMPTVQGPGSFTPCLSG